jgi:hypothetical protein
MLAVAGGDVGAAQGEECVCTTWDIFHEKLGWMLIYWNMCGVPLAYSFQSVFILTHTELTRHSTTYMAILFTMLLCAYYVWDTANSQVSMALLSARESVWCGAVVWRGVAWGGEGAGVVFVYCERVELSLLHVALDLWLPAARVHVNSLTIAMRACVLGRCRRTASA